LLGQYRIILSADTASEVRQMLKAKSADNTGCCKGERRQWRKQRTEAGAAAAECEGLLPRSTMRVPQPDIIEHFGNADAVPQPPERCLSRQAGIVRCCLRYCAETGRFSTLKCIWNLSKNSTAARVFPLGSGAVLFMLLLSYGAKPAIRSGPSGWADPETVPGYR
jgi:hypothetical protein